jgi:hypothetical protein
MICLSSNSLLMRYHHPLNVNIYLFSFLFSWFSSGFDSRLMFRFLNSSSFCLVRSCRINYDLRVLRFTHFFTFHVFPVFGLKMLYETEKRVDFYQFVGRLWKVKKEKRVVV